MGTSLISFYPPVLRLEDPLLHQLCQGWFLALPDPDRLLLSVDAVDVPQQRLSFHVGGGAHHVSALPGLDPKEHLQQDHLISDSES